MVRGAVTRSWLRIHARDTTQVQRGGGGGGCWATTHCGSHGSDSHHHGCWGSEISSVLIGLRRRAAVCESELQPGHFKSSWDCNTRVVPTWPLELAHTGRHISHTHTQTHTESIDAARPVINPTSQPTTTPSSIHYHPTTTTTTNHQRFSSINNAHAQQPHRSNPSAQRPHPASRVLLNKHRCCVLAACLPPAENARSPLSHFTLLYVDFPSRIFHKVRFPLRLLPLLARTRIPLLRRWVSLSRWR